MTVLPRIASDHSPLLSILTVRYIVGGEYGDSETFGSICISHVKLLRRLIEDGERESELSTGTGPEERSPPRVFIQGK